MLENDNSGNDNSGFGNSGFGKDYHGEDVFGGNVGGNIGGNGRDGLDSGFDSGFDAPDIDTTELSNTESAFEGEANEVADSMRESFQGANEETAENSNTGSMDTSFQIGGTEEDKEKYQQELERAEEELNRTNGWADKIKSAIEKISKQFDTAIADGEDKNLGDILNNTKDKAINVLERIARIAKNFSFDDFDRNKIEDAYKETGYEALRNAKEELCEGLKANVDKTVKDAQDKRDKLKSIVDSYRSSTTDKTKTSFTDKMKPTEAKEAKEDKTGTNMSSAKTSPSDYLTKANKDSTKETAPKETAPKETAPKETATNRNDYVNHAVDTLNGVAKRLADNTTAKALGIQSLEEFARENGYDSNKLSTMKAYQSYHNKEIMKAIPGIVKQIGSYITERVKDAFDPSQLSERIRNTLARYNIATLIGAVILSIKSGAGIQTALDMALTMVDTEDQPAVSDFLEDALKDRDTVKDLSNAIDGALAPEENSATSKLDEEIVDIGRKSNTDYDDFNAGIGTAGIGTAASDADVKVFIARNIKADPILRRMVEKLW